MCKGSAVSGQPFFYKNPPELEAAAPFLSSLYFSFRIIPRLKSSHGAAGFPFSKISAVYIKPCTVRRLGFFLIKKITLGGVPVAWNIPQTSKIFLFSF